MELLEGIKSKIIKTKNGENVSLLGIVEIVLVHCSIVNNNYQQNQESCLHLLLINQLVNYQLFHQKVLHFVKLLTKNFHILNFGLLIRILSN